MENVLCVFIVFSFPLPPVSSFYLDGCPLYGCKPSGTFSYKLNIPTNASVAWVSNFYIGPIPGGQGCVSDLKNVVCQANSLDLEDTGYVAIDIDGGFDRWHNNMLFYPPLPVMDTNGNVIGTDGITLTINNADGTMELDIFLEPSLRPVFPMNLVADDFILMVSKRGQIAVRQTNGIPVAMMFLNASEEGKNGTFMPIAAPIVNESRAYILTQFVPRNSEEGAPTVEYTRRLYAIDIYHRMVEPLTIAWYFNFEKFRPGNIKTDKTLRYIPKYNNRKCLENSVEDDSMEPSLLYDTETATVFVSLLSNSTSDSTKGEGQSTFWGIKDTGNNVELIFKKYLSVLAMAKYEASIEKQQELHFHSNDGNTGKEVKVNKGYLWVAASNGIIYGLSPKNGVTEKVVNISAVVSTKGVKVTSKIIVARRSDNSTDILIFGIKVPRVTPEFREVSTSFSESNLSFSNFVVAYDTSTSEERLLWKIPTPDNTEVSGQIVGISRSTTARKIPGGSGNIDRRDMLVAFSQTDGQHSTYFAVY